MASGARKRWSPPTLSLKLIRHIVPAYEQARNEAMLDNDSSVCYLTDVT
jgi:hypothetical protein